MSSTPGVAAAIGEPGIFPLFGDPDITYAVGRQHAVDQTREILREGRDVAIDTESFGLGLKALDMKCVQIANAHPTLTALPCWIPGTRCRLTSSARPSASRRTSGCTTPLTTSRSSPTITC